MNTALEAVKAAAGGNTGLAHAINKISDKSVTPQAISQWTRVPVERVLDIEKITGIPRHMIRPDIYPQDRKRRA